MKRSFARMAGVLAAVVLFGCAGNPGGPGWTTLIDGTAGMDNFMVTGGANWRAADGSIQADTSTTKGASNLVTRQSYRDFDLYAEFWAADDTNSGIYLRAMKPEAISTASGAYEVQIWDRNPDPKYATGSLVNVAAVQPIHKAGGRWNTYEVHAQGPVITVKFNGVQTAAANDGRFPEGRIALQFNGGVIKFRKLMVKPL
ncbi:MAG: uncharacterized protein JWN73_1712 [Betaproteobacteria bacterium]|nr:uncharacterized protein [Betaproteobacteria bacterium]